MLNPHVFASRLATAIKVSGKKKGAVAREAGVTPGSLSRYLSGKMLPDLPVRLRLATMLGVPEAHFTEESVAENPVAGPPVAEDGPLTYTPDAVALTGLDADDRRTVIRLLNALRSGDAEVRWHLIRQLEIIMDALAFRRQQPREERKDVS